MISLKRSLTRKSDGRTKEKSMRLIGHGSFYGFVVRSGMPLISWWGRLLTLFQS